jgi:thioredoxin-like negative regulator of GroEL
LPVVQKIAEEFAGRVRVVKVEWDRDGRTGEDFGSSGVPDYLVFRDGERIDRLGLAFVGPFLESRLRRMLDAALE